MKAILIPICLSAGLVCKGQLQKNGEHLLTFHTEGKFFHFNFKNGTRFDFYSTMFQHLNSQDSQENLVIEEEIKEQFSVNSQDSEIIWEKARNLHIDKAGDSTAGKNVHIVDTAFYMPQLNRYRRIWIYLPPSYSKTRKKFPVLYMQDGQNVFDNATSFSGEWGVDEALDTLSPSFGEMIVVAIDNGGVHRMSEYSPFDNEHAKAEGDAYLEFIVEILQPYINKNFRTKKCWKHNFIAGSSMGALISYYALLKYPKKFGGAGIFSPSFWVNPQLINVDPQQAKKIKGKVYFFAGMQESEQMVPDVLSVFEQVKKYSKAEITTVIRAEGKHSETTWREEFPEFYKWLKL